MGKYSEPKICIFNNKELGKGIDSEFDIENCHIGIEKKVDYGEYKSKILVEIDGEMPRNLHEYKVVIVDMDKDLILEREIEDAEVINEHYFEVSFPQRSFYTAPLSLNKINKRLDSDALCIVFADENYVEKYNIVKIIAQGNYKNLKNIELNMYDTFSANVENKNGTKFKAEKNKLSSLIQKYAIEYEVVFNIPQKLNMETNEYEYAPAWFPLLFNDKGEVVSYFCQNNNRYELMLPKCKNKDELIKELFTQFLPEIIPNIFPESKKFLWIEGNEYKTKEVLELDKAKMKLKEDYIKQLEKIELKQKDLVERNNKLFLDLLRETGDTLVQAVLNYFKWLGFDNVKDMDGSEDKLREDIQIDSEDKLYIIEVKGIGGTSTDSECSQIAKHRRNREKEFSNKKIIPIYIVNHQRYIDPKKRTNPPFSNDQIDYAMNDERGLLTTYQLFKQYKLIDAGIFTKEETRKLLTKIGFISLTPDNLVKVGVVKEYFKKPRASILIVCDCRIKIGDTILANKGDDWFKGQIISLQQDDINVEVVNKGEIGMVTDVDLANGYTIYTK